MRKLGFSPLVSTVTKKYAKQAPEQVNFQQLFESYVGSTLPEEIFVSILWENPELLGEASEENIAFLLECARLRQEEFPLWRLLSLVLQDIYTRMLGLDALQNYALMRSPKTHDLLEIEECAEIEAAIQRQIRDLQNILEPKLLQDGLAKLFTVKHKAISASPLSSFVKEKLRSVD